MNNTGIVILAAGDASRFGGIKQLLPFNGKTLLEHVIDEALRAGAQPVVVITGAYASKLSSSISDKKVHIVYNENWQDGIASGIVVGVRQVIKLDESIKKIILAVCDQPFVSSKLFEQLDEIQNKSGKPIVASTYANTVGTPALFSIGFFDQLLSLKGDEGAKKILKKHINEIAMVDFPKGEIDIDTQKDYETLLNK